MPNVLQTIRGKVPSKRALLAIGGAAAVIVGGAIQTTDTLAANNDAVSANTSQIASQNFFPVYAPVNPGYSTPGTCFGGNATLSWQPAPGTPGDQKWQIEEWGDGGTNLMWTSGFLNAGDRSRQTGMESGGGSTHEYRIYGINATTSERSTGYSSVYFWRDNGRCGYSKGTSAEGPVNISTWQQTTSYTPFDAEEVTNRQTVNRSRFNAPADASTTPKSTAPSSTSETAEPSTSETAEPSTSSTKPSTPPTSESTETSTEKEPVKITGGVVAGTESKFVVSQNGVETCRGDKDPTDVVNVGGNEVTLTTADGAVKKVDPDTCKVS